ncbi:MAG: uridine kinase [Candidatus Sumerlaeia bacterium]
MELDANLKTEIDKLLTNGSKEAAVIAVEGPIGGGKTSTAYAIRDYVGEKQTMVLSTDLYILVTRHRWDEFMDKTDDLRLHEWYDLDKVRYTLQQARQRKKFSIEGLYNLSCGQHNLTVDHDTTDARIIILEGLFALHESLLHETDLKVYIDVDRLVALERARLRDRVERNIDEATWQKKERIYHHCYSPYFEKHRSLADVIIKQD